jgi:hypothetical protein
MIVRRFVNAKPGLNFSLSRSFLIFSSLALHAKPNKEPYLVLGAATLSATTLCRVTFTIMTLNIMILSRRPHSKMTIFKMTIFIMTFIIKTFSIMTLSIMTIHHTAQLYKTVKMFC